MVKPLSVQALEEAYDPVEDDKAYFALVVSFSAEWEGEDRELDCESFRYEGYDGVLTEEVKLLLKERFKKGEVKDVALIEGQATGRTLHAKALVIVEADNPIGREFTRQIEEGLIC